MTKMPPLFAAQRTFSQNNGQNKAAVTLRFATTSDVFTPHRVAFGGNTNANRGELRWEKVVNLGLMVDQLKEEAYHLLNQKTVDVKAFNVVKNQLDELFDPLNDAFGEDCLYRHSTRLDLQGFDLTGKDLTGINLKFAILDNAKLNNAKLNNANLTDANLRYTFISGADFSGTNVTNAKLYEAYLSDVNLTNTRGLPQAPVVKNIDEQLATILKDNPHLLGTSLRYKNNNPREGWYILLAGEEGKALEEQYGRWVAGALIYHAAYPDKLIPCWSNKNEAVLTELGITL
ncbi:MAG: pentapeptide repeat-containing protein [Vampirovibrionales bacterium]